MLRDEIEIIKTKMLNWKDFYGGDISRSNEIKLAKTKNELAKIIEKHRMFLQDMAIDADSHLDNFKKRIGLNNY